MLARYSVHGFHTARFQHVVLAFFLYIDELLHNRLVQHGLGISCAKAESVAPKYAFANGFFELAN